MMSMDEPPLSKPVALTDAGEIIRASIVAARTEISAAVRGAIGKTTGSCEIRGIDAGFKLNFRVIVRLPQAAVHLKIWETEQMAFAMIAPPSTPAEAFDLAVNLSGSNVNVREGLAKVPGSAILFGYNRSFEKYAQLYGNADEFGAIAEAVLRAWMSFSGEYEEVIPKMTVDKMLS